MIIFKRTNRTQVLLLMVGLFILTGCGISTAEKGRTPGPDWSRGIPLTSRAFGTVGMAVENNGERLHLVWIETVPNADPVLRYYQVDQTAVPLVDTIIDMPDGLIRSPRILTTIDGRLWLLWALRPEGSSGWELWQAVLDSQGNMVGEPEMVSTPEMNVGGLHVAQNLVGDSFVVWEENRSNALVGWRPGSGEEPQPLVNSGENPDIQVDAAGNLHLAWQEGMELFYQVYENGALRLEEGTAVADIFLNSTDSLEGPALGVSDDWVYLVWSIFQYSGLEANTARSEYIVFPLSEPQKTNPKFILLPPAEEPAYQLIESSYNLTQAAAPATAPAGASGFTAGPDAALGQGDEVAVSLTSMQNLGLQAQAQMATVIFNKGQVQGYQFASKTQNLSGDGTLLTDAAGHLYLTWQDGSGNHLFYAVTEPSQRAAIGQLRASDIVSALLSGSLDAVVGVLLFPFALFWFLPSAIFLGIIRLFRDADSLSMSPKPRVGAIVILIIAIGIYYATKLAFFPSVLQYVPFSAWLDISSETGSLLLTLVPVALMGTGLLVAEIVRRRRSYTSIFQYFFIICGVDAFLTLAIYGVNFWGNI